MVVETISIRPKLIPSTRFLLALLVSLGFVVQYAQRTNLSIAIVCMINKTELLIANNSRIIQRSSLFFKERQFLWNEWDQQIILGSYWGGYLLTLIPSGWLSITLGGKLLFAISLFTSSLATLALSSIYFLENISFRLVVSLRILIGAAHGIIFPVTYTLWGQWAVPNERGTLTSIGFAGTNIGAAMIVLAGGLLCRYVSAGWIHIFLLSGILGFLWLPLWLWLVADSPGDHRSINHDEREYIQNIIGKSIQHKKHRPVSIGSLPWKNMIRSKPVIGLFFTELCSLFGVFFFLSNLGKLLTEIQHISSQYTGYILACGFIFMLIGAIGSGVIADALVQRNFVTLTNVRKLFNSIGLFVPGLCMISLCFCDENRTFLGIFTVILFLFSSGVAYGSGFIINFSDVVPAYSGLIFGIATSVSSLSAVIGNIIAGIVIKHPTLHDWRRLFLVFSVVYTIGGIIFILWGSAVPEKWATFKAQEQEQNGIHAEEETVSMQEQQQQPVDETNQNKHVDA